MIRLTRQYRFSASHRLHSPALSAEENAALYGKCNNPFGHGHNYVLEVTAKGEPDARTSRVLRVARLDALVNEKVLPAIAHRYVNGEIPAFAATVATTENIALFIERLLAENWDAYLGDTRAQLSNIRIQETERNSFELTKEDLK